MGPSGRVARLRRALPSLAVLASAALAFIVVFNAAPRRTAEAGAAAVVVYVGAEDCGPCRAWRRDLRPAFFDSDEFSRLRYREIIVAHLRDLMTQPDWPADLADVRERVRLVAGAPQWFILRGDKILVSGAGLSAWQSRIWPAIRTEVRYDPRLDQRLDPPPAAADREVPLRVSEDVNGFPHLLR